MQHSCTASSELQRASAQLVSRYVYIYTLHTQLVIRGLRLILWETATYLLVVLGTLNKQHCCEDVRCV